FFSSLSGSSLRWSCPWRFRFQINPRIAESTTSAVIYVATTTHVPAYAGGEVYPANTSGVAIEISATPGDPNQLRCRLVARNGYSGVAGTYGTSSWVNLGPSTTSLVGKIAFVLENLGNGTVNLYASYFNGAAHFVSSGFGGHVSKTPIATLTTGVPTHGQAVAGGWGSIMALLTNDGVTTAASGW